MRRRGLQGLLGHGQGLPGGLQGQGEVQEGLVALSLEAGRFQSLNPGKDHPRRLGQGLGQKALLGQDLPHPPGGVQGEDAQRLPFRGP